MNRARCATRLIIGAVVTCSFSLNSVNALGTPPGDDSPSSVVESANSALQMALGESLADSAKLTVVGTNVSHDGWGFVMEADVAEGARFDVQIQNQEPWRKNGEQMFPLTIEASTGHGHTETRDGLVIATDAASGAQTVGQPVEGGLRLMHFIRNNSAPLEFETRFSAPNGIDPVFSGGRVFLHGRDGNYLGQLEAPWAVDAAGTPVPTTYVWREGVLVQRVDHRNAEYKYPIVADPEWRYSLNTMASGYAPFGVSWQMVNTELRRCFNCSFPVSGAPQGYPKLGDVIRLNASPITLIQVPAPVKVTYSGPAAFDFVAMPGHFDGAGSKIDFNFYHTCSANIPTLRLSVNALVKKDNGSVANAANSAIAKVQWQRFIDNAFNNTVQRQGWRGRC